MIALVELYAQRDGAILVCFAVQRIRSVGFTTRQSHRCNNTLQEPAKTDQPKYRTLRLRPFQRYLFCWNMKRFWLLS